MDSFPGTCGAVLIILLSIPVGHGFMLDGARAATNITGCADRSEECRLLNSSINLCSKPGDARVMCPKFCNMCPVDGAWTPWTNWTRCDVTCGSGTQTRRRTCTNPAPANGGAVCIGNQTEQTTCTFDACPVPGGWGGWSSWGECSQTCGTGLTRRDRYCNNPYPQSGGDYCFGEGIAYQMCNVSTCSVKGGWGMWSSWEACSVTCGTGIKRRERQCDNPTPTVYADRCLGDYTEYTSCVLRSCSWDVKSAFSAIYIEATSNLQSDAVRQEFNPYVFNLGVGGGGGGPVQPYLNARFTSVIFNEGGDYSSTTGVFTCRIPGIYSFSVTLTENKDHRNSEFCKIYVNGVMKMSLVTLSESHDGDKASVSASPVFHLNRYDRVFIGHCDLNFYFDQNACSFSGFLIKPDE